MSQVDLSEVVAVAVAGQQHGMVCLDADGEVVRDALLWNDTRSAAAAEDLVAEFGDGDRAAGARWWADAVGSVPVASYTVTKLRWLADNEPENAARIAAVALPHDWLTWKILGAGRLEDLVTDRSDASGTGYFDPVANEYRRDVLAAALRIDDEAAARIVLPRVAAPGERVGTGSLGGREVAVGAGMGDNAGSALGMGLTAGDVVVSIGTSGVVCGVTDAPARDASGLVSGFADATGRFLPLAATLNGARVLDATARLLGVGHEELSALALAAEPGAGGLDLRAVPRGRAHAQPARRDGVAARHDARLVDEGESGARRGRGRRVRSRGCAWLPRGRDGASFPRAAHRRRRGLARGPGCSRRPVPRLRRDAVPGGVRRARRRAPGGVGDGRHRRPARVGTRRP